MRALGRERTDYIPNSMRLSLIVMCRQLRNVTFMRALLPYARRASLRRHALFTPFEPGACGGEPEFTGSRLPAWVQRTVLCLSFDNLAPTRALFSSDERRIALPYLSSVRWSAESAIG